MNAQRICLNSKEKSNRGIIYMHNLLKFVKTQYVLKYISINSRENPSYRISLLRIEFPLMVRTLFNIEII